MRNKGCCLLTGIVLVCCVQGTGHPREARAASPAPMTVLICYPGGSVQSQEAKAATDSMLRVIENAGKRPAGSMNGFFTSASEKCALHLDEQKPPFAIIPLGTFLAYREKLDLIPLAQPVIGGSSAERYRIMVRKGTFTSIQGLQGRTLGGALADEPELLKRVILKGTVDPVSFFILKSSPRVLHALRTLVKGDLDAVIVNSQQYRALGSLPFAGEHRGQETLSERTSGSALVDPIQRAAFLRQRVWRHLLESRGQAGGGFVGLRGTTSRHRDLLYPIRGAVQGAVG